MRYGAWIFTSASWRPALAHGVESQILTADESGPLLSPRFPAPRHHRRFFALSLSACEVGDSLLSHISIAKTLARWPHPYNKVIVRAHIPVLRVVFFFVAGSLLWTDTFVRPTIRDEAPRPEL